MKVHVPVCDAAVPTTLTEPALFVARAIPLLILPVVLQLLEVGVICTVEGVTVVPTVYDTAEPSCVNTPVKNCAKVE